MTINILIINAYSWFNKGDSGIVLSIIQELSNIYPKSKFTILSSNSIIDSKKYNVSVHNSIFTEITDISNILKILRTIKSFLSLIFCLLIYNVFSINIKHPFLNEDENNFLRSYINSDVVISCGGGFLNDNGGYTCLGHLIQIIFSLSLKKPTILFCQSIGPFRKKPYQILAALILNKVDIIILREEISRKILVELNISKPKILVFTDIALFLSNTSIKLALQLLEKEGIRKNNQLLVGITVRKWWFPYSKMPKEKYKKYLRYMISVINYLHEYHNAIVIFFPQVIQPIIDDDRIVARHIQKYVKRKDQYKIIEKDLTPSEIKTMIGQMDYFIGTRMHSNIYALSTHVPLLAISYEFKTEGIMNMFGLNKYVINIDELNFEVFKSLFNSLIQESDLIKKNMANKLEYLKEIKNKKILKHIFYYLKNIEHKKDKKNMHS